MSIPVSSLPGATLPLTGNERVVANQGGNTVGIKVSDLGGGGGGTPTLALTLASNTSQYLFNSSDFSNWTATVVHSSADAVWNDATKKIDLSVVGTYQVGIAGSMLVNGGAWPSGSGSGNEWTHVGSTVTEATGPARSRYTRWATGSFGDAGTADMQWYDSFLVKATSLPATITPKLYGSRYSGTSYSGMYSANVTVQRMS